MITKRRLLNRISMLEFDVEQLKIEFDIISKSFTDSFKEQKLQINNVLKCPSKYRVGQLHCQYGEVTDVEPAYYYKPTDENGKCTLTNKFLSYRITFEKDGVVTTITEKTSLEINSCER